MTQHHIGLAHHFETREQQKEAATLGMWAFLATELMLFGGIFTAYLVYRWAYPESFVGASSHLNMPLATINTVVLLVSSLTVALSVHAAENGKFRRVVFLLITTIILGIAFLGIKGTEYYQKYAQCVAPDSHECLAPGRYYAYEGPLPRFTFLEGTVTEGAEGPGEAEAAHGGATDGERIPNPVAGSDETMRSAATEPGPGSLRDPTQLFFLLYFFATGVHAIHMIVGITVMSVITWMAWRGRFTEDYYNPVEIGGLYWHLIDIIWVFLFPLFYLVD